MCIYHNVIQTVFGEPFKQVLQWQLLQQASDMTHDFISR